jgi:predicted SprT family Zn-dependent metalloprotease
LHANFKAFSDERGVGAKGIEFQRCLKHVAKIPAAESGQVNQINSKVAQL